MVDSSFSVDSVGKPLYELNTSEYHDIAVKFREILFEGITDTEWEIIKCWYRNLHVHLNRLPVSRAYECCKGNIEVKDICDKYKYRFQIDQSSNPHTVSMYRIYKTLTDEDFEGFAIANNLYEPFRKHIIAHTNKELNISDINNIAKGFNYSRDQINKLFDVNIFCQIIPHENKYTLNIDQYTKFNSWYEGLINGYFRAIPKPQILQVDKSRNAETRSITDNSLSHVYVDVSIIATLRALHNDKYDLNALIKMCEEINDAYERKNFITVCAILRTIMNHVPPIFGYSNFSEIANNYGNGGQATSFNKQMRTLEDSAKHLADEYLHKQISSSVKTPSSTTVYYGQPLCNLLEEVIRILKRPNK